MANTNYPSTGTPQTERPASNNSTRNVLIGLLAVALLGTWGYILYQNNDRKKEEKE